MKRRRTTCLALLTLATVAPSTALAHDGGPLAPHDLPTAWNFAPVLLLTLGLGGWLYGRGLSKLWRHAGAGHGIRAMQAAAFALGWATLAVALVSPLHALGETLFAAHMLQHLLMMLIAAPLIVLGLPHLSLLWAIPSLARGMSSLMHTCAWQRFWPRVVMWPLVAWAIQLVCLLLWHVPAWYEAAVRSELIHALEHGSLLAAALVFWTALLQRHPTGYGVAVLAIFATAIPGGALGALIALAPRPWYALDPRGAAAWGLTPLADQQLAGVLMWMPASVVYLVAAGALFVAWLRAVERRVRWREELALRLEPSQGEHA